MSHRRWLVEYAAVRTSARTTSVLFLLAGLILAAPAAAQLCEGASSITRLGGANRFSAPVEDQESLQALFANQREDILSLLDEANWSGDADDLLAAVAAWRGVTFDHLRARPANPVDVLPRGRSDADRGYQPLLGR